MRYAILEQFFGQHVDVSLTSRGTLSGILKPADDDAGYGDVVELEPESERSKKRYGSWVLDKEMIVAVRLIKPHVDEDDEDCKAECDADS